MKDEPRGERDLASSVALPLVVIALFMIGAMAGGFFVVRKLHLLEPESASATPTIPPTPPGPIPTPTPIPPPTPTLLAPTASVLGPGTPPSAASTIARLRPAFRACYNRGLASDPTMSGNIVLEIEITASGDVASVTKVGGVGLSSDVESCIVRRARSASFDPIGGGSGTKIRVPISFVSS